MVAIDHTQFRSYRRENPWDRSDPPLWLLTPGEREILERMFPGLLLDCINGSRVPIETADGDTRAGYLAYGVRGPVLTGWRLRLWRVRCGWSALWAGLRLGFLEWGMDHARER